MRLRSVGTYGRICSTSIVAFVMVFIPLVGAAAQGQHPDDQCRDILRDGTLMHWTSSDNQFFKQLVYQQFMRSTYQESKRNKAFGLDVSVGEFVLGSSYTEDEFKRKQGQLQTTFSQETAYERRVDVAVSSGDEKIVEAWSKCMSDPNRGGLSVRLEPKSPREVNLFLEWHALPGVDAVKTIEAVSLPAGTVIRTGKECFRKGTSIGSLGCQAQLTVKDALTTLDLMFRTDHGYATTYLARRLVLRHEPKSYRFSRGDSLEIYKNEGFDGRPRRTIELSDSLVAEGFRFDPTTWSAPLNHYLNAGGPNSCWEDFRTATAYRLDYGYRMVRHPGHRRAQRYPIACRMEPSIKMFRDRWVSADSVQFAFVSMTP